MEKMNQCLCSVERFHQRVTFYLSDERQPQQEANDSDEQHELHPVSGTPQLLWEQVSDGCGQGLYSYELAATHVRVSVIIRS